MGEGKVARNTAYLLAASVGQKLLALVYFMVVARLAGVEGTGQYVIATTFALVFSSFADLGMSNVVVREVARAPEKAIRYLSAAISIKALLILVVAVVSQVVAWLMGYSDDVRMMIAVATLAVLIDSVSVTFYAVLRGFQNLRPEAVGVIIGQVILVSVGTVSFFVWRTPLVMVAALLCTTVWNFIWSALALGRHLNLRPSFSWNKTDLRFVWLTTLPFALAAVFSRIYSYVDSLMLSKLGTEAQVGLYGPWGCPARRGSRRRRRGSLPFCRGALPSDERVLRKGSRSLGSVVRGLVSLPDGCRHADCLWHSRFVS